MDRYYNSWHQRFREVLYMLDKARLQKITEIDRDILGRLDDSGLADFIASANFFIDNYPAAEEIVKNALKEQDRSSLISSLSPIMDMLLRISANDLAQSCNKWLGSAQEMRLEDLQACVIDFLKSVSALSIDLQVAVFSNNFAPESVAEQIREPASSTKNTILAVDDRHFFLSAIKTMLQDTGYRVTCINSGASALNYLKTRSPDLFLLDIEMPEMDGYELAKRIKEAGHTAPIVFLTGNANKDSVVNALKAGAADFIIKPVTKEQLLHRIGKYIQPEVCEDE